MSQAESLLNDLTETTTNHTHVVPDSDTHFIVDPYTRQIENTNYNKTVLMQGDHNSERFTFEIPRYIDGHDMSLCNRVIVHFDNIGETGYDVNSDVAYMTDLRINPDKPDTIISSWLIRREATQIVGILSFSLQYQCIENEEVTYEWNTDSYDGIEIRKSKNNGEGAVVKYSNVLEEWRSQIFGAGDSVMANITSEGAHQVATVQAEAANQRASIELKGSDTLATIPGEYTEIYNMASEAVRTKADSISCNAEGSTITINNSSDDHIRGLNVYGRSTQVSTTGKNLVNLPQVINKPESGYNYDLFTGTVGQATPIGVEYFDKLPYLTAGTYYLNAEFEAGAANTEIKVMVVSADGSTSTGSIVSVASGVFTIETDSMVTIRVGTSSATTIRNIQIEDGDTYTGYEPYTGGKSSPSPEYPQDIISVNHPTISIFGSNLFDVDSVARNTNTSFTVSDDKYTITAIGGTANIYAHSGYRLPSYLVDAIKGKTLYLAADEITTDNENTARTCAQLNMLCTNSQAQYASVRPGRLSTLVNVPNNVENIEINIYTSNYGTKLDSDVTGVFKGLRLTVAENIAWESFRGDQTLEIANDIHGIPVTSGGNHTDENGQQWICDEVDLERGVYIQRFREVSFTGQENWVQDTNYDCAYRVGAGHIAIGGLCTHYPTYFITEDIGTVSGVYLAYTVNHIITDTRFVNDLNGFKAFLAEEYASGHPVTVLRRLTEPTETPLTAEEILAFRSLKSNYPNTTVMNDHGAFMKVKYNADTKLYIAEMADNRASNLVEEVLNGTY